MYYNTWLVVFATTKYYQIVVSKHNNTMYDPVSVLGI